MARRISCEPPLTTLSHASGGAHLGSRTAPHARESLSLVARTGCVALRTTRCFGAAFLAVCFGASFVEVCFRQRQTRWCVGA